MKNLQIGVCSWSVDREDVCHALEVVGLELGLRVAQIGFFGAGVVERADADAICRAAERADVVLAGGFLGFDREDYASIESIAATGGFAFDEEYRARLSVTVKAAELIQKCARRHSAGPDAARAAACLAVHAGTIPSENESPVYGKLVDRTAEVADLLAEHGVRLLLETGRESAEVLDRFIETVGRRNIGVNFDPGNFVVYGTDDPGKAVSLLRDRIENIHMKDACRSERPGKQYGRPAELGRGDVNVPQVLGEFLASGYRGPLLIERGGRQADLDRLQDAIDYIGDLLKRDAESRP
jgi:sugar phosphate isomerase/epimerase